MFQVTITLALLSLVACNTIDRLYVPLKVDSSSTITTSGLGEQVDSVNTAETYSSSNVKQIPQIIEKQLESNAQVYPSTNVKQIPILSFSSDNNNEGSYRYSYESGNGIISEENGSVEGDGTKVHGSYSYTLPDGQHVSITYTADENGFVAQGSHIPTPHPIPEAILKALEENAAAEARGIFDDGQYHGEKLEDLQHKVEVDNSDNVIVVDVGAEARAANTGYKY